MTVDLISYRETFLREAVSYVESINFALLKLEKDPTQSKILKEIFHALHTLKSLLATMNYHDSTYLCHVMEDLLSEIEKKKLAISKCFDVLFQCVDHLSKNLKLVEQLENELPVDQLVYQLKNLIHGKKFVNDGGLNLVPVSPPVNTKSPTLEIKVERLNKLMNLTEELLINKMRFESLRQEIENLEFITTLQSLDRLITDLQYHVMQARLTSIEFLFNKFIRMTRDLAKQQGKEVELQFDGGDIELDRMLIDEIGETIAHLIRNAIGHGLETPEVRRQTNKSPVGRIKMRASRSRDNIIIEVSDDGAGLDLASIKEIAIKRKLVQKDASMTDIKNTIFAGLSTTKSVTEISGRGLGLSIVKQKVESIGGTIRVESVPHTETAFFIEIPLTLAVIKTLFVQDSEEIYAIPIEFIERLLMATPADIKEVLGHQVILFENRDIPVVRLASLFDKKVSQPAKQPLVVLHKGNARLGLAVDSLISTEEVVIKPLNRSIKDNKFISGVTLIGSGRMVLILDIVHLLGLGDFFELARHASLLGINQIEKDNSYAI